MTRLGLGSYALAWSIGVEGYPAPQNPMTVLAFLRHAHNLGFKLVQIADNLPLDRLTESERDALVREAKRLKIAVEVGTRGIDLQHLRTYLSIAQQFESPILRVVVDTKVHHPEPAEVVTLIREMLPELDKTGIRLAIENHDRFPVETLAAIIREIDHPSVGICLDTVNSFGSLEGPRVVVTTLAPYVVNLHVKDFTIRRLDHNMGFSITGTPAGEGMLDLPWLMQMLQAAGRNFNAILELWPPPEKDMAATIAKEQKWVEQSFLYLRKFFKD